MKQFKKYGGFIALLFGVVAVVMLFIAPALKYTLLGVTKELDVTGFKAIFGNDDQGLKFNILGFIALVLLAGGLVVPLVPAPVNIKYFLGAALLLVAGILFFVFPSTIQVKIGSQTIGEVKAATTLIVAGVMSLVASLVNTVLGIFTIK